MKSGGSFEPPEYALASPLVIDDYKLNYNLKLQVSPKKKKFKKIVKINMATYFENSTIKLYILYFFLFTNTIVKFNAGVIYYLTRKLIFYT